MERQLLDFLNGTANAVRLNVVISREVLPNGSQYIVISSDEGVRYEFYQNPKKPAKKDRPPPKHTGGKKPYIMLMVDEVEQLREQGVSNVEELIGFLACLGKYIEWNTGRLIHKRSKKLLKYKDLQNIFTFGNKKLNRILNELKSHDLLFSTQEWYVVATRLIKKGKTK